MHDTEETCVKITGQEFHTVLAALRYYQMQGLGEPDYRPPEIHEIASNCGDLISSLDVYGIDQLCERINTAPAHMLTVTVEGGIVQNIDGLIAGMAVKVMDFDHEGEDAVIESVWTHKD